MAMSFSYNLNSSKIFRENTLTILLALFTIFCLAPSQFNASVVILILLIASVFYLPQNYKSIWRNTWKSWLLFFFSGLLPAVFSPLLNKSLAGLYDLIRGMLVFFIAGSIILEMPMLVLRQKFKAGAEIALILLLIFYFYIVFKGNFEFNLRSNIEVTNIISGIHEYGNALAILLLVYISALDKKSLLSLRTWLVVVINVLLLITSDSRGAYLAILFCLVYMLSWFNYYLIYIFRILAVVAVLFMIYIFLLPVPEFLLSHIPPSFLVRIELYMATLAACMNHPWLGYGLNSFKYLSSQLGIPYNQVMPHNIFLELLFSVGLIGILLIVIAAFTLLQNNTKQNNFSYLYRLGIVLIIYTAFRGLTELHLGFKVYSAVSLALAFIIYGKKDFSQNKGV